MGSVLLLVCRTPQAKDEPQLDPSAFSGVDAMVGREDEKSQEKAVNATKSMQEATGPNC